MSQQPFNRLAPFIQEYIYTHGWEELRQVQIEACRVIFESDAHLLLAAGTASGKTEAAFLPVLTLLHENPSTTVGVLYISPIKALINDQFDRLSDLLKQTHTEVYAWHGDISQSRKKRLLKNPQGILQITPESLESLLINKTSELNRLFGDLRFVVIDEIHAFMGTERGCQILCQLTRLSQHLQKSPRRIGLSATLGDYFLAEEWLQLGTETPVITPQIAGGNKQVRIALEHFYLADQQNYYQYLFNNSKARKCLIFTNNRTETELIIANLRQVAQTNGLSDVYHVHHGSISATLREEAEAAMRESTPAVIAATVTLELGIDLRQLERVIQINAPFSVSSFLQRLGRTGRRGKPADMQFVCTEDQPTEEKSLPEAIPWQLLQCIAIIQLYLEERWIEPISPRRYPFSLLYHQTMSILASLGELSPAALAQQVLTLPTFQAISQSDFRQLLRYLIDIDHIQQTEKGKLIIGLAGEKIVRNFRFYSVFSDNPEYIVKSESGEIGSIALLPNAGDRFALAGRTWEVLETDPKRKTAFVKPVRGLANIFWRGNSSAAIHTKILRRMRQALLEDTEYPYLQSAAKKRLNIARKLPIQENIVPLEDHSYCIFPWMGTTAFRTLERVLNLFVRESVEIKSISGKSPYFLIVKLEQDRLQELYDNIVSFCNKGLTDNDLVASAEAPKLQKYDEFIPNNLLRKAFAQDYLDLTQLRQSVSLWRSPFFNSTS